MRKTSTLVGGTGPLLVAATLLVATSCKETPRAAPPAVPVKVAAVIERDVPIYKEWLATTVGLVTAQIRPKVNPRCWRYGIFSIRRASCASFPVTFRAGVAGSPASRR
jgi:hypothetical protein